LTGTYLDVQRVEVNSGPQGTIRGRNASGGSINIISHPAVLGEWQANAQLTFGNYRQRAYQGMVNVPIGDHLALRVAGASTTIDPTWVNAGPIDDLPGAQDTNDYAFKAQLRFKPNSKFDVTAAGDYTLQRTVGFAGANLAGLIQNRTDNGTPLDLSDDPLAPIDPNSVKNPRRIYQRGRYPATSIEHWGTRLDATYDAGPFTVELLGSYRFLDWLTYSGANAGYFVDPNVLRQQNWDNWSGAAQQHNNSKSTLGELRIASPDNQQFVWSMGLFAFYEDQGAFLGQITGDPGGFNEFNMPHTRGSSIAAYADATFKITPAFRVLGGLRVSAEHKDRLNGIWMIGNGLPTNGLSLCAAQNAQGQCVQNGLANAGIGRYGTEGFQYKGLSRNVWDVPTDSSTKEQRVDFYLAGIKQFGVRDQTAISLCNDPPAQLQTQTNAALPPNITNPGRLTIDSKGNFHCAYGVRDSVPDNFTNVRPQNGRRNDKYVDFRIGTEYDLLKDSMLYATLASGHKAGGFNDSIPNPDAPGAFLTPDYGPETAYALEIGSKNLLADRRLRLNASAFGYLYKGLQFQTIITVGEAPPLDPITGRPAIDPTTGQPYPDNRGGAAARQNAQDVATIYGLDVDAVYSLPLGLEADLHTLLVNARFPDGTYVNDDRLGLGSVPVQVDIGGNWLPRVPPFTFNYSLSQLIYTTLGSIDWIIQGQTVGRRFFTAFNGDGTSFVKRGPGWGVNPITGMPTPIEVDTNPAYAVIANNIQRLDDRSPIYTQFNVSLGWRRPDGLLSIRGFVNNLFNVTYASNIASSAGNNTRNYNDPRMMGVRVRMDF